MPDQGLKSGSVQKCSRLLLVSVTRLGVTHPKINNIHPQLFNQSYLMSESEDALFLNVKKVKN